MRFLPTSVAGARLIEMQPSRDERGFFGRTFCADTLQMNGLENQFIQHSLSFSKLRGTIRGMHFQRTPHEETKLVRCLSGKVWDVILDLRPTSPTYMQWDAFELSRENRRQLYVPKGCAHGFQALSDDVEMSYMISTRYSPAAAAGVRHDDPAFGIKWPLPTTVMSERDQTWPDYQGPISTSRTTEIRPLQEAQRV